MTESMITDNSGLHLRDFVLILIQACLAIPALLGLCSYSGARYLVITYGQSKRSDNWDGFALAMVFGMMLVLLPMLIAVVASFLKGFRDSTRFSVCILFVANILCIGMVPYRLG